MAANPNFAGTLQTPAVSFANADGTTIKTILTAGATAGASGSRIDTLFATNTDTGNAYVLQLSIQKSGVDYIIGEVNVPLGAGTNGSAKSVAVLNSTDIPGLAYTEGGALYLATGASLRAKCKTTVAGANTVSISGCAVDY